MAKTYTFSSRWTKYLSIFGYLAVTYCVPFIGALIDWVNLSFEWNQGKFQRIRLAALNQKVPNAQKAIHVAGGIFSFLTFITVSILFATQVFVLPLATTLIAIPLISLFARLVVGQIAAFRQFYLLKNDLRSSPGMPRMSSWKLLFAMSKEALLKPFGNKVGGMPGYVQFCNISHWKLHASSTFKCAIPLNPFR